MPKSPPIATGVHNTGHLSVDGDLQIYQSVYQYITAPPPLPKPLTALHQLPAASIHFVGRRQQLHKAVEALRAGIFVCITGMPGCGKTAFAIKLANILSASYPDAQLFIELQSSRRADTDVNEQLSRCLDLIRGFKERKPVAPEAKRSLFRSSLSGTKSLVVLDDVVTPSDVESFQPPSGCGLVFTSRHLLNVKNCVNISLGGLEAKDAVALVTRASGRRLGAGPSRYIAELCGFLPLALEAAGGFLKTTPDMSPEAYVQLLRSARGLHDLSFKAGGHALLGDVNLESVFKVSFQHVTGMAFGLLCLLTIMPGSWDAAAEEHIFVDPGHVLLSGLLRFNLILFDGSSRRYRCHDFVRDFARSQLPSESKESFINVVHASYYCALFEELAKSFETGAVPQTSIYSKYAEEEENIVAAQRWSATHFGKHELAAPATILFAEIAGSLLLHVPISLRQHAQWVEDALAAARFMKNQRSEIRMLGLLALQDYWLSTEKSLAYFQEGLRLARATKDWVFEAQLHRTRALVEQLTRPELAMRHVSRALEIYVKNKSPEFVAVFKWVADSPILAGMPVPSKSGFN